MILISLYFFVPLTSSLRSVSTSIRNIAVVSFRCSFSTVTIQNAEKSLISWQNASTIPLPSPFELKTIQDNTNNIESLINIESLTNSDNVVEEIIHESYSNFRISQYLKEIHPHHFQSSNKVYQACKEGRVLVNGRKVYSTHKLQVGDSIVASVPASKIKNPIDSKVVQRLVNFTNNLLDDNIEENNIDGTHKNAFRSLYEDDNIAIVFKPAGIHSLRWINVMKKNFFALDDALPLLLQPPRQSTTLTTPIQDIIEPNEDAILARPMPCHRLDARVAGCLLIAKTSHALNHINLQFQNQQIHKEYRAILVGRMPRKIDDYHPFKPFHEEGSNGSFIINATVFNRPATTEVRIIQHIPCNIYGFMTHVSLSPRTGRRHQLRQHCALMGYPMVGDDLYHDVAYVEDISRRHELMQLIGKADEYEADEPITKEEDAQTEPSKPLTRLQYKEQLQHQILESQYPSTPMATASTSTTTTTTTTTTTDTKGQWKVPKVRKGVGLFLQSVSIEFEYPSKVNPLNLKQRVTDSQLVHITSDQTRYEIIPSTPTDPVENPTFRLKISVDELSKFQKISEKAIKGFLFTSQQPKKTSQL